MIPIDINNSRMTMVYSFGSCEHSKKEKNKPIIELIWIFYYNKQMKNKRFLLKKSNYRQIIRMEGVGSSSDGLWREW